MTNGTEEKQQDALVHRVQRTTRANKCADHNVARASSIEIAKDSPRRTMPHRRFRPACCMRERERETHIAPWRHPVTIWHHEPAARQSHGPPRLGANRTAHNGVASASMALGHTPPHRMTDARPGSLANLQKAVIRKWALGERCGAAACPRRASSTKL